MPIKPENRARYPKNWKQIRAAILERAGNKCERCGAPNGEIIERGTGPCILTYKLNNGKVYDENTGEYLGLSRHSEYYALKIVKIVLTIAHLDHQPENNISSNLAAYCQKCHLRYDSVHHRQTAYKTRRSGKAEGDLFAT